MSVRGAWVRALRWAHCRTCPYSLASCALMYGSSPVSHPAETLCSFFSIMSVEKRKQRWGLDGGHLLIFLGLLLPFYVPLCFVKAPCPWCMSTPGPSATPSHDLSCPRLQGASCSLIYQELGLSPQGRKIFLRYEMMPGRSRSRHKPPPACPSVFS